MIAFLFNNEYYLILNGKKANKINSFHISYDYAIKRENYIKVYIYYLFNYMLNIKILLTSKNLLLKINKLKIYVFLFFIFYIK